MEEKGQTGIQLNHLFLNIITTVKTASSYMKKCSLHLLLCVLGEDFTGEAGHHVQDVIIELFREPESIDGYHRSKSSSRLATHLCFLGACKVLAVARCSTIALIISSKKNQEQSVTSFLVWSLDKVSCRASCSWTSFPRLVLPSAASAPRSPPGIISHFFGTSSSDCTH